MSELVWIKHDGGPMPVPGDTQVKVRLVDGCTESSPQEADEWPWHPCGSGTIAEYAIVTPTPSVVSDPVKAPSHYGAGADIECIDAIKAQMSADQFAGYLRGNIVKYLWRYEHKGGAESLEKAEWYLKRLIQEARS